MDINRLKNLDSKGKTIVCFGNSLTEGYMIEPRYSVPSLLQKRVSIPVANHGISGDTTFNAMLRIDASIGEEPRIAIIELGVNDIGWDSPMAQVIVNLSKMIKMFQEAGAVAVLAGFSFGNTADWESAYRELAESHSALLVPDIYAGIYGNSDLLFADGLHPNEKGYAVMEENYYRVMRPLFERMGIDKGA